MVWRILYLVGCGLTLGLASLTLIQVHDMMLWRLSLIATEVGHWLFFFALGLVLFGVWMPSYWKVGAFVAAMAGLLFLVPLFQVGKVARHLPGTMEQNFGPLSSAQVQALPAPFSLRTLWIGANTPPGPVKTEAFVERSGKPLHLDFYSAQNPVKEGAAPCVVMIHGGGWSTGSPREFIEFNRLLAKQGYAVAAIEYRLAPQSTWPAARDDVFDAIRYLKAHAAELGIDPTRFVLFGRSAGGQIAEAAAYEANDPAICGCIAFYAPADMHFAFRYADRKDILNSYQLLVDYLGGTPDQVKENYDSGSAILQVKPTTPPTLLLHGRHDPLVWFLQSERLATRLQAEKVPHAFINLPWATHAFDFDRRTPGGQIGTYAVLYFLAATLGASN